jgi:hypothetical protein
MNFDSLAFDTHFDHIFSNDMLEPFLDQQAPGCSPHVADTGDFPWLEGNEMFTSYSDETSAFAQLGYDGQGFSDGYGALTSNGFTTSPRMSAPVAEIGSVSDLFCGTSSAGVMDTVEITSAELDHYRALIDYSRIPHLTKPILVYLFFTAFCKQVPLVHSSTWSMEDKPDMLTRAMQACGALFVKTERANNFISETLACKRDTLIKEFVSKS